LAHRASRIARIAGALAVVCALAARGGKPGAGVAPVGRSGAGVAPVAAPSLKDAPAVHPPALSLPQAVAADAGVAAAPSADAGVAPGSSTTVVATAPGAETAPDEGFDLKVKNLEESVNELKEKIFRTKARLLLLQETVLGGDITSGAKAVLVHRNEMGSTYVLEQASYALDGAPIFTRLDNEGDLDKKQEIEIFNGRIIPGNHQISVKLQYRGHGFGVFSYIEGYKFKVQSSYTFNADGGKVTQVKIVGYEKGNITTDLKDRPAVKYDVEVTKDSAHREVAADAKGEGAKAPAAKPQDAKAGDKP
jgi:hypothetical protein